MVRAICCVSVLVPKKKRKCQLDQLMNNRTKASEEKDQKADCNQYNGKAWGR